MAFFTSQQLFGNGSGAPGSGGWVPVATTAPPTFSANNRGVAFGEQLTSAIANRPHYALALNDDDLNTRLALFETSGLDAAYDLGALATPGGGRVITKDGGAVETVSAQASQYADDRAMAHFRANMLGDTSAGGGFESVAASFRSYGYMARSRQAASLGGSTIASTVFNGTLNPASVGVTIIRLTGQTVHTAGATGIGIRAGDMIEVYGPAAPNGRGVYIISALGPTNNDAILMNMDGTSPTFTPDTACTCALFRASAIVDYRMGAAAAAAGTAALALFPQVGGSSALVTAMTDEPGQGYGDAIRHYARNLNGAFNEAARVTGLGQRRSTVSGRQYLTGARRDAEMRTMGGVVGTLDDRSTAVGQTHEVGMIFKDLQGAATTRSMLENWQTIVEETLIGIHPANNGTFASPSGRILLPDSDGTPAAPTGQSKWQWASLILPGITYIEMLSGPNVGEHYRIDRLVLTGASTSDPVQDEFYVTDLDGGSTTLPTAGAFTFRFIARDFVAAKMPPGELYSSPDPFVVSGDSVVFGHFFNGQAAVADVYRTIGIAGDLSGGIGVGGVGTAGTYHLDENWVITKEGNFRTEGGITAISLALTSSGTIPVPTADVNINQHLMTGQTEMTSGGLTGWWWDQTNGVWVCRIAGAIMYFPIQHSGRYMGTLVQVFHANTGSHDIIASMQRVTPVFGVPATPPTYVNGNATTSTNANAWREIVINHGGGSGVLVALQTNSYAIRVEAASIGDQVRALRHTVRQTTITRNG